MALNLRRWLAAAIVLCGVALIVILRDASPRETQNYDDDFRRREARAGEHVSVASERLRFLRLLDSVQLSLARPTMASRVVYGGDVPPNALRVLHQLVETVARDRPATPRIPVDLVFIVDTAPGALGSARAGFMGTVRTDYVLPRDSGDRCVVIGRVRVATAGGRAYYSSLLSAASQRRLLGPCGFFETFGLPSAPIRHWLDAASWSTALVSPSTSAYAAWRPSIPWFAEGIFGEWSFGFRLRAALSQNGFLCAAGSVLACDSVLLERTVPGARRLREARLWENRIVSPIWGVDASDRDWVWYRNAAPLGPRQSTVLAEMARTLGQEQFQRFWTANEPVQTAFERTAGMRLGIWGSAWASRMYSRPARGPGVSASALLIAAGVVALSLAYSIARSTRRQVA